MRAALTAVAIVAIAATSVAAEGPVKTIAPYLDDETFAVVRLDLAGIDANASVEHLAKFAGIGSGQVANGLRTVREAIGAFQKAGAKEIFAVISMSDLPNPGPFVLAPRAGANDAELTRALRVFGMETVEPIDGMMFAGSQAARERLRNKKPAERSDLTPAFASVEKSPLQFILVPSDDQRRVVQDVMPNLPKQIGGEPSTVVTQGVRWAALGVDLQPKLGLRLVIQSKDAACAKSFYATLVKAWAWVCQNQEVRKNFPQIGELLRLDSSVLQGDRLVLSVDETATGLAAAAAALTAKARSAAARSESMNHLKQIGLAWHNFHDATGAFPKDIVSKDGEPLLSWRVAILPYIEQNELYRQFKLDEPWDSEHNKKLLDQMPAVYRSPAQNVGEWKTCCLSPTGQTGANNVVNFGVAGVRIRDVVDGTSNTVMIVEANDDSAVTWTKPGDLNVESNNPIKGLVGHFPEGFIAMFADGSVRFIPKTITPKNLLALFTRNGGEVANGNEF